MKDTFFKPKLSLNFNGKLHFLDEPWVMGILNVTPDSFYDGGKYSSDTLIIQRVQTMLDEGAKIIDIGGCSTRPGATEVSIQAEKERVLPVIKLLKSNFPDCILSIDTFRSDVVKAAVGEGASMVNDISGGQFDNNMHKTIGELQVPYVLMHTNNVPSKMQQNPNYSDIILELLDYFNLKVNSLLEHGCKDVIIDPGFGFGKTLEHNYELLNDLDRFNLLGWPIMVGVSRKSMIYKVLGCESTEALNGTTVLNTMALIKGASILRVHDVKEATEAIKLVTT